MADIKKFGNSWNIWRWGTYVPTEFQQPLEPLTNTGNWNPLGSAKSALGYIYDSKESESNSSTGLHGHARRR